MRKAAAIAGLSCVVILLTGCVSGSTVNTPTPTASTTSSAREVQPSPTPAPLPSGIIGTGTLTSDNGTIGDVSVEVRGDNLVLKVSNLVTPVVEKVEPLRNYLVPVDSGETGGARGIVEIVEIVDGTPAAYTVASKDLIEEVAKHLGMRVDDLN